LTRPLLRLLATLRSAELGLTPRRAWRVIVLIGVGALALRLFPLLLPGGPLAYLINYDEGIYFSASALLMRGALPYRDVFFVHPPGMLLLLAPFTSWASSGDAAAAFAGTRYLITLIGAGNAVLAGVIALRAFGPLAGVSAALLYATFPEAVREERGPFLEPVLNFACLAMASVWLQADSRRRQWAAGLLGGLALSVKTWGAIWLVAAFASAARRQRLAAGTSFLIGLVVALAVLVLPFALPAPEKFLAQIVGFHVVRGPQGVDEMLGRIWDMVRRHPLTSLLALVGFAHAVAALRKGDDIYHRAGRFFALVLALTVASFLVAPIYFHRYASFIAPSAAVLGGLGVVWIHQRTRARWPALAPALLLLAAGSQAGFDLATTSYFRAPQQLALASVIQKTVPPDASIFSLEPGWIIVAGRLPDGRDGVLGAWAGFQTPRFLAGLGRHPSPEALRAARATGWLETRRFLESFRFLVTGDWPLNEEIEPWLERGWIKRHPAAGARGLALWEQRP
jgi:hypothetical protein